MAAAVKRTLQTAGWLLLLAGAFGAAAPLALGQAQIGDNLRMGMTGTLTGGYAANYGDHLQSNHSFDFGADGQINGDYYSPNFLNFSVSPYYDRSTSDSDFQSLTNASGVNSVANFFGGSKTPGSASFSYTRNSTGNFGLIGTPNFTSIGTGYGFGIGWSLLLPDKPTLSVSYSQGSGTGNILGTDEESHSSTKTFNVHSNYHLDGWNLGAYYQRLTYDSNIPYFLSGELSTNENSSSGNYIGATASHTLPLNGSLQASFSHNSYSGDYANTFESTNIATSYSTNIESAAVNFRPTLKLSLYANENYTDNLNGFLYQNIFTTTGGLPINQQTGNGNSFTTNAGVGYNITNSLYTQGQITYFQQSYLGHTYEGSYLSGTLGYNKRVLNTFSFSASVVDSTNQFNNNNLGFIVNVNGFHAFGDWLLNGNFNYAQNVQTILVTYTTSYYIYNANLHRRLGRGKQVTFAYNGAHSGLNQDHGSYNYSNGASASLAIRRVTLTGNYISSYGLALLTSTGIQPIQPTPGLPPVGEIVYNGRSYGASIGITPVSRMSLTAAYSHALSDTLSNDITSNNRTEIFYTQLQYRLRRISLFAGYTKFSQGISASGTPPGNNYSYFIGVSRWFNFF